MVPYQEALLSSAITEYNKNGNTALSMAISYSNINAYGDQDAIEIMKYLIKKGSDANRKKKEGITPLMHAAGSDYSVVQALLKEVPNIRVNTKDKDGYTALDYVPRYHESTKKILEARGAKSGKSV